ncbi:MAG: DUF4271 domain-containing protein [Sphingobacteriaceae bacterium]
MPKLFYTVLFLIFFTPLGLLAQTDSVSNTKKILPVNTKTTTYSQADSVFLLRQAFLRDSLKKVADSLTFFWIKNPDPARKNSFIDSLVTLYKVSDLNFTEWSKKFPRNKNHEGIGRIRRYGEGWIIITILALIVSFALFSKSFSKEIDLILTSFYSQRLLSQIPIGGQLFSTWPFIILYLLFGFTIGMYLFLIGRFFQLEYFITGLRWYVLLSLLIILLFALKIFALRFLGYLLQIQGIVKTYISMLYLSYFHAAILFLPLIFCFSLSSATYSGIFLYVGILLTILIIVYQLIRVSTHMLTQSSFPKFYLFVYLCALEICPILILIKALRF